MLSRCPKEAIRPMFAPQFQPGLCEPANRSGTRGVGYDLWPYPVTRATIVVGHTRDGVDRSFMTRVCWLQAKQACERLTCVIMFLIHTKISRRYNMHNNGACT